MVNPSRLAFLSELAILVTPKLEMAGGRTLVSASRSNVPVAAVLAALEDGVE